MFGVLVLAAVSALVMVSMPSVKTEKLQDWRAKLGISGVPMLVAIAGAILWGLLTLALSYGLIRTLLWLSIPAFRGNTGLEAGVDWRFTLITLAGLTATLGAVVALPVTLSRLRLTKDQTDTAKESLYNQKITEAAADLYARRLVTLDKDDHDKARDVYEDDIVRRSAAIDRLEGLVDEQSYHAARVVRLLSLYVRELSREFPRSRHPYQNIKGLINGTKEKAPIDEEQALKKLDLRPNQLSDEKFWLWTHNLEPVRTDMEKAAQAIGRMSRHLSISSRYETIDFRKANLQGMDLSNLDFCFGRFDEADLSGTRLHGAKFEFAILYRAVLDGSEIFNTDLSSAVMLYSTLYGTELRRAKLIATNLDGVTLNKLTKLDDLDVFGASVRSMDLSNTQNIERILPYVFGDGSVSLPSIGEADLDFPPHWPQHRLDAKIYAAEWDKWRKNPDTYTPPKPD